MLRPIDPDALCRFRSWSSGTNMVTMTLQMLKLIHIGTAGSQHITCFRGEMKMKANTLKI